MAKGRAVTETTRYDIWVSWKFHTMKLNDDVVSLSRGDGKVHTTSFESLIVPVDWEVQYSKAGRENEKI